MELHRLEEWKEELMTALDDKLATLDTKVKTLGGLVDGLIAALQATGTPAVDTEADTTADALTGEVDALTTKAEAALAAAAPPATVAQFTVPAQELTVALGSAADFTLVAENGQAPYAFASTDLPAGLSIDAAGHVVGTPSAAGVTEATITATDATGLDTATGTLTVTVS